METQDIMNRLTQDNLRKNKENAELQEMVEKSIQRLQKDGETMKSGIDLLERSTALIDEYLRYKRANFLIGVLLGIVILNFLNQMCIFFLF